MKLQVHQKNAGNLLVCALCTILVVSLIGANVLVTSATRYNVSSKQLKAWKEALYAAEAGGDIGFAEVRKTITSPSGAFSGWTVTGATPTAGATPAIGRTWSKGTRSSPINFGQTTGDVDPVTGASLTSLSSGVTVDEIVDASASNGGTAYTYYRIRSMGTAHLFDSKGRLGVGIWGADRRYLLGSSNFAAGSATRGVGDTLLRKIDYKYDHFAATYGDGDGNTPSATPAPPNQYWNPPQITRRVEVVAVPKLLSFTGSLEVMGKFFGPGSAGQIDSYDSKNGAYPGYATAQTPSSQFYADSRDGDVHIATKFFQEGGPIYGDVTTDGGNVKASNTQISGTIDNNVPFSAPSLTNADVPLITGNSTVWQSWTNGSSDVTLSSTNSSYGAGAYYRYSGISASVAIHQPPGTYNE